MSRFSNTISVCVCVYRQNLIYMFYTHFISTDECEWKLNAKFAEFFFYFFVWKKSQVFLFLLLLSCLFVRQHLLIYIRFVVENWILSILFFPVYTLSNILLNSNNNTDDDNNNNNNRKSWNLWRFYMMMMMIVCRFSLLCSSRLVIDKVNEYVMNRWTKIFSICDFIDILFNWNFQWLLLFS